MLYENGYEDVVRFIRCIWKYSMIRYETERMFLQRSVKCLEYTEWANRYLQQAKALEIHIKRLKRQIEDVPELEQNMLKARIYMCYQMYLECKHMGEFLNRRGQIEELLNKEREALGNGKTSVTFGSINRKHTWGTTVSISE